MKQSRLELDAIKGCYWALDFAQPEPPNPDGWRTLRSFLRGVVRRGNAKELRRNTVNTAKDMSEETEHQADKAEPAPSECKLCGTPTLRGTPTCNRCWELESRIKADPKLAESILNSMRGSIRSKAKTAAARANGKAGGRPTLPPGVKGKYERRTA